MIPSALDEYNNGNLTRLPILDENGRMRTTGIMSSEVHGYTLLPSGTNLRVLMLTLERDLQA